MTPLRVLTTVPLVAVVSLCFAADAHAICDYLALGGTDDHVLLGEWALPGDFCDVENDPENCDLTLQGYLAACVNNGTELEFIILDCGVGDLAVDQVELHAGDGNDRVAAYWATGDPTAPMVGDALRCGDDEMLIAPWPSYFEFGIAAYMGRGADFFLGSHNDDWVLSNDVDPTGYPADRAWDVLCGFLGADYLGGDRDDDYLRGREEVLVGGWFWDEPGDRCDGDPGSSYNGGDLSDLVADCPTTSDAYYQDNAIDYCRSFGWPLEWDW